MPFLPEIKRKIDTKDDDAIVCDGFKDLWLDRYDPKNNRLTSAEVAWLDLRVSQLDDYRAMVDCRGILEGLKAFPKAGLANLFFRSFNRDSGNRCALIAVVDGTHSKEAPRMLNL